MALKTNTPEGSLPVTEARKFDCGPISIVLAPPFAGTSLMKGVDKTPFVARPTTIAKKGVKETMVLWDRRTKLSQNKESFPDI